MPVPAVAKLGLLRTFQQTRIYSKLNCVENMLISHKASDSGFIFAKVPTELTEKAENLLNFVGLYQKRNLRGRGFIIWPAKTFRISNGINE